MGLTDLAGVVRGVAGRMGSGKGSVAARIGAALDFGVLFIEKRTFLPKKVHNTKSLFISQKVFDVLTLKGNSKFFS